MHLIHISVVQLLPINYDVIMEEDKMFGVANIITIMETLYAYLTHGISLPDEAHTQHLYLQQYIKVDYFPSNIKVQRKMKYVIFQMRSNDA